MLFYWPPFQMFKDKFSSVYYPNINRGTYVPATVWHTMSRQSRGLRPRGKAAALRARGEATRGKAAYNVVIIKPFMQHQSRHSSKLSWNMGHKTSYLFCLLLLL